MVWEVSELSKFIHATAHSVYIYKFQQSSHVCVCMIVTITYFCVCFEVM